MHRNTRLDNQIQSILYFSNVRAARFTSLISCSYNFLYSSCFFIKKSVPVKELLEQRTLPTLLLHGIARLTLPKVVCTKISDPLFAVQPFLPVLAFGLEISFMCFTCILLVAKIDSPPIYFHMYSFNYFKWLSHRNIRRNLTISIK